MHSNKSNHKATHTQLKLEFIGLFACIHLCLNLLQSFCSPITGVDTVFLDLPS